MMMEGEVRMASRLADAWLPFFGLELTSGQGNAISVIGKSVVRSITTELVGGWFEFHRR